MNAMLSAKSREKEDVDMIDEGDKDGYKPKGQILPTRKKVKKFVDMHKRVQAMLDYLQNPNIVNGIEFEEMSFRRPLDGPQLSNALLSCLTTDTQEMILGKGNTNTNRLLKVVESELNSSSNSQPALNSLDSDHFEWENNTSMEDDIPFDPLEDGVEKVAFLLSAALLRFHTKWENY